MKDIVAKLFAIFNAINILEAVDVQLDTLIKMAQDILEDIRKKAYATGYNVGKAQTTEEYEKIVEKVQKGNYNNGYANGKMDGLTDICMINGYKFVVGNIEWCYTLSLIEALKIACPNMDPLEAKPHIERLKTKKCSSTTLAYCANCDDVDDAINYLRSKHPWVDAFNVKF